MVQVFVHPQYHFGVGEFTSHFRLPILVVGLGVHWAIHWGYGILTPSREQREPWVVGRGGMGGEGRDVAVTGCPSRNPGGNNLLPQ